MDSLVPNPTIDDPLSCGRLTIDLNAYAANWQFLRDKVSEDGKHTQCAAVVKGNAYGIVLENAVSKLIDVGCETFFVATPNEAISVRKVNQEVCVYVLSGLLPGCAKQYINNKIRPVLNTLSEIKEWVSSAGDHPAALHVDTGMNRLGLREEEAKELACNSGLMDRLNLSLIMSHLACGDTPRALMNGCQLTSFNEIAALFPGVPRSLCNSAGIFNGSAFHLDMVRPGIALYGGAALQDHIDNNPMRPVVKAEARILQIRDVLEHESVGYGAAEVVEKRRKIATISVGYADGYVRHAGSATKEKGANAFVNGHLVPLVGRVSMDLIAIDVTDVPDISRGDYVELFGPNVPISTVARAAETIDYEFLTGLGGRYQRVFGSLGGDLG